MGREEGSGIHYKHLSDGTNHTISWYCQQHTKTDQLTSTVLANAFATLKTHINDLHGNVEQ